MLHPYPAEVQEFLEWRGGRLLVRSDLKRQGLGTLLLQKLVRYCRARGTQRLWREVMCDNTPMLHLARSLGFDVRYLEGNLDEVALDLQPSGL